MGEFEYAMQRTTPAYLSLDDHPYLRKRLQMSKISKIHELHTKIEVLNQEYKRQYYPLLVEQVFESLHCVLEKTQETSLELQKVELDDYDNLYTLDIFFGSEPESGWHINDVLDEHNLPMVEDLHFAECMNEDFIFTKDMTFEQFKNNLKL